MGNWCVPRDKGKDTERERSPFRVIAQLPDELRQGKLSLTQYGEKFIIANSLSGPYLFDPKDISFSKILE